MLHEHEFRVMGSSARLLLREAGDGEGHAVSSGGPGAASELLREAEQRLRQLEAMLTRFDSQSQLERLNDSGRAHVGPVLRALLVDAEQHRIRTGGRFDIGVGAHVIAAGYDRSFEQLEPPDAGEHAELHARAAEQTAASGEASGGGAVAPAGQARYTVEGDLVVLRDGVRLDLGGIAKGWAADRAARALAERSGASSLVSLGGDISVQVAPGDDPWPIAVDAGSAGDVTLALAFGGMATSGRDRRTWRAAAGAPAAHHVIDPATGEPCITDILRITVVAASCAEAEAWATALMQVGWTAAIAEADERGLATLIVRQDGSTATTGGLALQ